MYLPAWLLLPLGPIVGSWLGVMVRRGPAGRPVVLARSACETCHHRLAPLDMVPLVSFAALGGRCRYCGAPIGWFAPAIELAALAVAAAALVTTPDEQTAWIDTGLGLALLAAAWIDAETLRLPDLITLPLILAGLAVTGLQNQAALYDHAAAAALGYAGFRLLNATYRALRHRDGLGAGDAKLLAAAGAWLGAAALPQVILLAGLLGLAGAGLVLARHKSLSRPIPFGPALALAFFALQLAAS